jgi:hypothetical protein
MSKLRDQLVNTYNQGMNNIQAASKESRILLITQPTNHKALAN